MSYEVTTHVHDGQATTSLTGQVPDGIYTLSGHEDDSAVQVGAQVRDLDGRYRGGVTYQHSKEA